MTGPECDSCGLVGGPCPGIAAHCAESRHCCDVDVTCSADTYNADHGGACCFCEAALPPGGWCAA